MEQFIILLIWLGMGLFGLIAKARNKQKDVRQPPPDWLDDQWQELIQQQEPPPEQVASGGKPAAAAAKPPPLPAPTAARTKTPVSFPTPAEVELATPAPAAIAPVPVQPSAPLGGSHFVATPKRKRRRDFRKRRTSISQLLTGSDSLRKAMLLREVIDRPRAYDV